MPSFGKLRTANMHFGQSGDGTPYISDGDSARVLFFFNLSGAYGGNARVQEAKDDAAYIVRAVNAHDALVDALEAVQGCPQAAPWLSRIGAWGKIAAALKQARA